MSTLGLWFKCRPSKRNLCLLTAGWWPEQARTVQCRKLIVIRHYYHTGVVGRLSQLSQRKFSPSYLIFCSFKMIRFGKSHFRVQFILLILWQKTTLSANTSWNPKYGNMIPTALLHINRIIQRHGKSWLSKERQVTRLSEITPKATTLKQH